MVHGNQPTPYAVPIDYRPTSERLSEDHYASRTSDYLIYLCHLATYDFVVPSATGKRVLDFGCGTGYGTHRLAPHCTSIVGVDISEHAISFARSRYEHDDLEFRAIEPLPDHPVPFADGSFDVIVSFQVIEHIWDDERYVAELARLLVPGGTAIVATPDRATRLFPRQRPWNLYHVREYDDASLARVMASEFGAVSLHYLTAEPDVAQIELRRTRRLRALTYPVTFPHAPEPLRVAGLRALTALQRRRWTPRGPEAPAHPFDLSSVRISPDAQPALDLIAVAHKAG